MSISDAQFAAWLAADNQQRVILCEAMAYSGAAEVTRYMATRPYVSTPTDTPANTAYDDIIVSIPTFTRRMSEAFTGATTQSWGDIEILNEGGALDAWLDDGWDGRSLSLYIGDPSWPKSDFCPILAGVAADISAKDAKTLAIKARDKTYAVNVPIQTNLIGGTTVNAGKPVPLLFGECYNITPLLIDAATHKYQYHDGAAQGVTTAYDNGVAVAFTDTPASGFFTLAAAPAGQITCDAKGAKPGGTYLTKVADIVNYIVTTRSTLSSGDIDAANFTAMNATAAQTVGLYIDARENIINALDDLATSVGGWWGFSRAGLLQLGVLIVPAGTPALTLGVDDIAERGVSVKRRDLPLAQYTLGWKRCWTVQTSGLAGAVTEATKAVLGDDYQSITKTNAAVLTKYRLADKPDRVGSLLVVQAEADAEAQRRVDLRNVVRKVFALDAFSAPMKVDLGQVGQLTHPRFGFAAGKLFVVVGIEEQPTKNRVKLEVWL